MAGRKGKPPLPEAQRRALKLCAGFFGAAQAAYWCGAHPSTLARWINGHGAPDDAGLALLREQLRDRIEQMTRTLASLGGALEPIKVRVVLDDGELLDVQTPDASRLSVDVVTIPNKHDLEHYEGTDFVRFGEVCALYRTETASSGPVEPLKS